MRKLFITLLALAFACPAFAGWGSTPPYTSPWIDKAEANGVVYLLRSFPFELARYDLATKSWLAPIELASSPRSLATLPDGLVIAFGTKVSRFDFKGGNEQILENAWADPSDIAADDGYLFVFKNREIQSIRLSDGVQVDLYTSFGGYDTPDEVALSPGANQLFGWNVGLSPSDILRIGYDPATGLIEDAALSSPYHGDYPRGGKLWVEPSGQRLFDRAGIAYRGVDLTYISGLGGYVRDAVFRTGQTLLARDDRAALLDANQRELGVVDGLGEIHGVAFAGNDAVIFGGIDGTTVTVRPLASFEKPQVVEPSSPHAAYAPTHAAISDAGVAHLFQLGTSTVHRFDVNAWSYLPSIGLPPETDFVSLDTLNQRLYVAQTSGRISVVPQGGTRDTFLSHAPPDLITLGAMDNHVMTADLTGAWESHRVFNGTSGLETDWMDWNYGAQNFTWSRSLRRQFFFRDGTSPIDLHYEEVSADGHIVGEGESPLHGGVEAVYPIRVQPAGAYVLLGSGQIFDGISIALLGSLGESMTDAAWVGTSLFTMRPSTVAGRSELVRWSSAFVAANRITIPGTPVALFAHAGQIIAVTRVDGFVRFFRYAASLTGLNVSSTLHASHELAPAGTPLTWNGSVSNEGTSATPVTITISFNQLPTSLTLICEIDGTPIACAAGTPIPESLNSGSSFSLQAFGNMPSTSEPLIAQLTAAVSDDRPEDNQATATVQPDHRIFWSGFEGN